MEKALIALPWHPAREGVDVKLLPQDNELYVLAQSRMRIHKERGIRQRKLRALVKRLRELQQMKFTSAQPLLLKLGEVRGRYRAAWRLLNVVMPDSKAKEDATFSFSLNRSKLREVRRREGRYLLRTNLCDRNPAELWQFYIQLVEVEAAFKTLKDDLALRPIHHQLEHRIEAPIFVAFMAYCLNVTRSSHNWEMFIVCCFRPSALGMGEGVKVPNLTSGRRCQWCGVDNKAGRIGGVEREDQSQPGRQRPSPELGTPGAQSYDVWLLWWGCWTFRPQNTRHKAGTVTGPSPDANLSCHMNREM
jgi:hypothetical protein